MAHRWGRILGILLLVATPSVRAQDSTTASADTTQPWYEGAWKRIVEREGVGIAYLFYSEADNENNGVVLRLKNQNDYAVHYEFTVLFRGPQGKASAHAEGTLAPGEMKTGSNSGLFWIPFEDGRRVGELGVRGLEIRRTDGQGRSSQIEG